MGTKLFSILLASFILMQSLNIQITDVYRLSELVEHYKYHTEKYGDNVFIFFSKHYGELKDKHHDNHQKEEHNQLPFSMDYTHNSLTTFILHKIKYELTERIIQFQTTNFFYFNNYVSVDQSDIFQPPKNA